ncbi:MAG: glycosyltransferase, partial [Bacteroidales bacterium]|nr:glycosyltransferase [Bacteroidales bacterium]
GSKCGTKGLVRWLQKIGPDVVHLHNLHINYLNYRILFDYLIMHHIPVVFTLHDCFSFTGLCSHYTVNQCHQWERECGPCPYFHSTTAESLLFDHSKRMFLEKKAYYSQLSSVAVVAVSQWLQKEAERSILAGPGHSITSIYNWVDVDLFKPASKEEIDAFRRKYQLDENTKYLLSVSQLWEKNQSRFKDAVQLAAALPNDYKLILVGHLAKGSNLPASIIHIPYISGVAHLAVAYSSAEAYVHLSIEDSFGKVIAEAMACGTVPVVFNSTACAEITGPYGVVCPPHDVAQLVRSLPIIPSLKTQKEQIRSYVREHYDKRTNLRKYMDIYQKMAGERSGNV